MAQARTHPSYLLAPHLHRLRVEWGELTARGLYRTAEDGQLADVAAHILSCFFSGAKAAPADQVSSYCQTSTIGLKQWPVSPRDIALIAIAF